MIGGTIHGIIRVSVDVLWPHYGLCMCQAAALLLVPDILLTDKKNSKKGLQLTLYYTNYFTVILNLPNIMSGVS